MHWIFFPEIFHTYYIYNIINVRDYRSHSRNLAKGGHIPPKYFTLSGVLHRFMMTYSPKVSEELYLLYFVKNFLSQVYKSSIWAQNRDVIIDSKRWYLSKNTMSTVQRNWIVNWFDMKFGELNRIVNWIEMKCWWLNWIVNWLSFWCNVHLEELNLNWIQTLCLNLNWVVNQKKLNCYISGSKVYICMIFWHFDSSTEIPNNSAASFSI